MLTFVWIVVDNDGDKDKTWAPHENRNTASKAANDIDYEQNMQVF